MLNPRQFKTQLKERATAAYEQRADKFLDYMERRGESTKIGMNAQLSHLEQLVREAGEL